MKRIKKYNEYIKENKYQIPNISFLSCLNKYVEKDGYVIDGNMIISKKNIDGEYSAAMKIFNIINKNKIDVKNYVDVQKYSAKQYVGEYGFEAFNYEEDAVNFLEEYLETDFPYGLNNVPKYVKLYRVLFISSEKNINKTQLGLHFMPDKNLIDSDFLFSIDGEQYDWEETPPYLIEVLVDRDEINWEHTISSKMSFPYEHEITMKSKTPKLQITSIKKLDI